MAFSVKVHPVEEDDCAAGPATVLGPPALWHGAEGAEGEGGSLVAYQLDTLPHVLGAPVLVAGFGSPMRAVVKACDRVMKGRVYVTGTQDKLRGFSCADRAQVVALGPQFDKRLFANAYSIAHAATECAARAILLVDQDLSDSPELRAEAARCDIALLAPVRGDRSGSYWVRLDQPSDASAGRPQWRRCPRCKMNHDMAKVLQLHGECPACGALYRLNSTERIAATFDAGTFQEWDDDVAQSDPLRFPDFDRYIERAQESGFSESVRTGYALLGGYPVAVGIMDTSFLMGSLGYVAGEKLARMVERATNRGLPVVVFTASGGARMQEGLVSLMQMAKVSVALERHGRAGLPYFSVITDPTTGGVTASFAMQGDVVVAEPGALVGFAGQRVIRDTIKQELPQGFQTAEFALEHGLIDAIVPRRDVRAFLASLLALHVRTPDPAMAAVRARAAAAAPDLRNRQPAGFVARMRGASRRAMRRAVAQNGTVDAPGGREVAAPRAKPDAGSAWESVVLARNVKRPTARYYLDHMVHGFVELHGDRAFADDGAIVGGVGWIGGRAVTVIAQEKGVDLKDRIARNFGCPQPEGYRKSRRLMQQAQKFGRPIVCLVDTQGAYCGTDAEQRGQGNAIAENLLQLAGLTVPVVSVIVGEGGSGGALALALANRVAMQEHAVYSVLSPEGFASILWKDRSRAPQAAAVMKMSAREARDLGIVEEVLSEGPGPAHENPEAAANSVADFVTRALDQLAEEPGDLLRDQRFERFRAF